MQFSTLAVSAMAGVALAQTTNVHVVTVSSKSGGLTYTPNNLKAAVGDMVQFQFAAGNHTVTQSTFDQPCQPIDMNSNVTGFYSGFMAIAADATDTAAYTIPITSATPIWVYCSQASHCQKGMTMVINENPEKNSSRTLAEFQKLAALATANLPGSLIEGGTTGTVGGSNSSGTSPSSSATSNSPSTATNAAMGLSPSVSVAGVLALFMGLLM